MEARKRVRGRGGFRGDQGDLHAQVKGEKGETSIREGSDPFWQRRREFRG